MNISTSKKTKANNNTEIIIQKAKVNVLSYSSVCYLFNFSTSRKEEYPGKEKI
jgi:hypothetical protein